MSPVSYDRLSAVKLWRVRQLLTRHILCAANILKQIFLDIHISQCYTLYIEVRYIAMPSEVVYYG